MDEEERALRAAIEAATTREGKTLAKLQLGAYLWDRLMAIRAAREEDA